MKKTDKTMPATSGSRRGPCVALGANWLLAAGCTSSPPSSLSPDAAGDLDAQVDSATADARPSADATTDIADAAPMFACTLEELQPIGQCAQDNCSGTIGLDAGLDTTAIITCITTSCWQQLLAVSPSCRNCLTNAVSGGSLQDILGQCSSISLGG